MLTSLDSITDQEEHEYLRMKKAEIMGKMTWQSKQQQSPSSFGYGNFNNTNQFQAGLQVTFNSCNFANSFQLPPRMGGNGLHQGGTTHYEGNGGSRTSGAKG